MSSISLHAERLPNELDGRFGAVQLSPTSGTGRSQVELFMPANTGAPRSTLVTVAEPTPSITQAGR